MAQCAWKAHNAFFFFFLSSFTFFINPFLNQNGTYLWSRCEYFLEKRCNLVDNCIPSREGLVTLMETSFGSIPDMMEWWLIFRKKKKKTSDKQAQNYNKYGAEKENTFNLLANGRRKRGQNAVGAVGFKSWNWQGVLTRASHSRQAPSLNVGVPSSSVFQRVC